MLGPLDTLVPVLYGEAATVHRRWFPERAEDYGKDVADRLRQASQVTLQHYLEAQAGVSRLRHTVQLLFEEVDLLLTPATAITRKLIGEDLIEVGDEIHHYRKLLSAFSAPVNYPGNPALVLPLTAEGEPPPALQLIGPQWGEARLLEAGARLEEAGISTFRPPPRW